MKKAAKYFLGVAGLVFILGCGSINPADAPLDSAIVMEPSDSTLTASASFKDQGIYTDTYFDIKVVSLDGLRVYNGVEVVVTMDFAPDMMNTSDPFVQLIDDNGDVQVSPWHTETGSRGTLRVGVRVLLGVQFTGTLIASIAYSQATSTITETLSQ